jgi:TatD DNase family protein
MANISLIDAHCHLDFVAFEHDRNQVLQRAKEQNISDIIIPGTEKNYWDRINKLCATDKHLHACYGLHPYWIANENKKSIEDLDRYIENSCTESSFIEDSGLKINSPVAPPVALGECGLDFRPQQADEQTQRYFFEAQLDIAQNRNLPVIIHSVRATETVIQTIKKFKNLRGMVHSYSGSVEQARQLIELNFYISISGSVTYDNAKKIKTTAREIPLESLLLETDAPDQIDKINKSANEHRNEPAYLVNTLNTIAELRGTPVEIIAEQTTKNAKALFGI